MGMYTEFHFNSALKRDVPEDVIKVIRYMLSETEGLECPIPDHDLFKTERWRFMLGCDSYYFDADTYSTLRFDDNAKRYYLCIRCNFKNYDDEIRKFMGWIKPYLDKDEEKDFLGFYLFEVDRMPTLIFMGGYVDTNELRWMLKDK